MVNTAVQGNAAVAAEQEKSIATATDYLESRLNGVSIMVKDNTDGLERSQELIVRHSFHSVTFLTWVVADVYRPQSYVRKTRQVRRSKLNNNVRNDWVMLRILGIKKNTHDTHQCNRTCTSKHRKIGTGELDRWTRHLDAWKGRIISIEFGSIQCYWFGYSYRCSDHVAFHWNIPSWYFYG